MPTPWDSEIAARQPLGQPTAIQTGDPFMPAHPGAGPVTRTLSRYVYAGHDPRSPLVPTRIPGIPLAQACCVDRRWWIVILDGDRLRQARSRAGLSQRQLAAAAGIGRATIGALESRDLPRCHFRTRGRIAAALGTHPKAISAPGDPLAGAPSATVAPGDPQPVPGSAGSRRFPGRPDQVREARAFLQGILGDCPVADAALLVCSELAANAVQHSRSARPGGAFTVRAQFRPDAWAWVEVQDDGGRWAAGNPDAPERGRGLIIVDELASYWDIREDVSRVICARLDWPPDA
jgi:DNA-binding XRE family transcriptional regulator/anti-sigma regulatory factor (Ser/Thr protein kinase)